jgi:aspartate-semialdehyde dehydrogenase
LGFVIPTEKFFISTRNLVVNPTRKDSSVTQSSFRMTVAYCHSDREVFYFDEESHCHSDREAVFASTRNIVVTLTRKDSSVAKSSFRMTVAYCHSDREVFLSDKKITAEKVLEKFKAESKDKP